MSEAQVTESQKVSEVCFELHFVARGAAESAPQWPASLGFELNTAPKHSCSLTEERTGNKAKIRMETAVIFWNM